MTAARVFTAYERGPAILHATVVGLPIPQGSIKSLGRGLPSIHSNAERLKPWRERVHGEFLHRIAGRNDPFPLLTAVAVDVTFTMPKPKSAAKTKRTYPITMPDCDKLQRAIGDALQEAGVVRNDSQIVEWCARKVYPNEHPSALGSPGAVIYVHTIGAS